ncbi:MAG: DUF327 family protein [Firmicutes bacterium]|nr:DUF327 family protein [Bacillota bacterium]
MKISRSSLSKKKSIPSRKIKSRSKMDSFSQQFQNAKHKQDKEHLNKLFNKIKKKGKQVIDTQNIKAAYEYKKYIKEYLEYVLNCSYNVKKLSSMWGGEPLSIIDTINDELDSLVKLILKEEKETLKVVDKVSKIQGLLIDIHQ